MTKKELAILLIFLAPRILARKKKEDSSLTNNVNQAKTTWGIKKP